MPHIKPQYMDVMQKQAPLRTGINATHQTSIHGRYAETSTFAYRHQRYTSNLNTWTLCRNKHLCVPASTLHIKPQYMDVMQKQTPLRTGINATHQTSIHGRYAETNTFAYRHQRYTSNLNTWTLCRNKHLCVPASTLHIKPQYMDVMQKQAPLRTGMNATHQTSIHGRYAETNTFAYRHQRYTSNLNTWTLCRNKHLCVPASTLHIKPQYMDVMQKQAPLRTGINATHQTSIHGRYAETSTFAYRHQRYTLNLNTWTLCRNKHVEKDNRSPQILPKYTK